MNLDLEKKQKKKNYSERTKDRNLFVGCSPKLYRATLNLEPYTWYLWVTIEVLDTQWLNSIVEALQTNTSD